MASRRADGLATAAGLLAGAALDAAVGDPRRGHPVALYGRAVGALEERLYAPTRGRGAAFAALAVAAPAVLGAAVSAATRRHLPARAAAVAVGTWAVLGGTTLRREAAVLHQALDEGDLPAARARLPHLCGRDSSGLDGGELARAAVESVAENTSDAVVAPLLWGAAAGLPGLLAYRAVNTLDAMVGHRTPRYARFGWASARLDDLANWLPARVTALLTVVAAPVVGGRAAAAWRTWRRDGARHPSPNAGRCEASAAGALGIRLGGRNVYAGRVEERPALGDGRQPVARDVHRAAVLSGAVGALALALAAGTAALAGLAEIPGPARGAAARGAQRGPSR